MTTWPPRIACTATPSTAINPSQRSHGRFSFTQSNTASASVRNPKPPATTRCENSNRSPPWSIVSGGIHVPWDFGQSVTERAASFEVTSAPATRRRTVQHTAKTENLCTPGLYVGDIALVPAADYTPDENIAPGRKIDEQSVSHKNVEFKRWMKSGRSPDPLQVLAGWTATLPQFPRRATRGPSTRR